MKEFKTVRRKIIKLNEYAFTDSGARNEHVESLHKTKSAQLGLARVFPPRKRKFADKLVKPSALLLRSVKSICHCIFWVIFWWLSSRVKGSIWPDTQTKKDVLVGFLRPGVAGQVTHARLPSAWSQRHLTRTASGFNRLALRRELLPRDFPVSLSLSTALTVANQRVNQSLQPTVQPEMRTGKPPTELGVVFHAAGKSMVWERTFFFFVVTLVSPICAVRNRIY